MIGYWINNYKYLKSFLKLFFFIIYCYIIIIVDRGVRMKKFLVLILFMVIFISGCGKRTTYDEISYNEFKKLVENKESFPLVIGSSTCSACSMFRPTMEAFIKKYNIDVKYIDISKLSEDENGEFSSNIGFKSTPTTVFFVDGKQTSVYDRIVGSETMTSVVESYKRMGYIGG